jgi:beta-glucosidase-like glycosyl hydrolase
VPGECPYLTGEYGSYIIRGTQEGEAPEVADSDSSSRYLLAASTMKHFQLYDYEGCESHSHTALYTALNGSQCVVVAYSCSYSPMWLRR